MEIISYNLLHQSDIPNQETLRNLFAKPTLSLKVFKITLRRHQENISTALKTNKF